MAPRSQDAKQKARKTFPLRKTLTTFFLGLTILLSGFLLVNQTAHASSFESPINVSLNDGLAWQFTLADAHENVYLAWQDQTPGIDSIFFSRSHDRGATFSEPVNMSMDNDGPSFSHDMVASGDRVFLALSQLPGPFNVSSAEEEPSFSMQTLYLRKSTDNGNTFGAPVPISPPGYDAHSPSIAVSGRNVYVGWEGTISDDGTVRIFFARSIDGGRTFSEPMDFGPSVNVRVAAHQNHVYLAWDGGDDLMFARSEDHGKTFEETANLSDNPGYSAWSTLLVGPRTGHVYAAWLDGATGFTDVYFRRSLDNGMTFEPIINVSDNEWHSGIPDMALHGNNLYIVWSEEQDTNYEVLLSRSRDGGASFETPVNISRDKETSWEPTVAAYREKVFVGWQDNRQGNFDTFVAESNNWGGKI